MFKTMKGTIRAALSIIMTLFILIPLAAAGGEAAWSSDMLDAPLSTDGSIRRDGNEFSFQVNSAGIPSEPLYVVARLSDDIDPETGMDRTTGEKLFNPDDLVIAQGRTLVRLGGELTSIQPGSVTYTDNHFVTDSEGENVDLIRGASARIDVKYNPANTHQKGVLWYVPDGTGLDFSAGGGQSQATVFGTTQTFDVFAGMEDSAVRATVLRALSIYDPWFDDMEALYDSGYGNEDYRVENWKIRYLSLSDEEHRNYGYTEEALGKAAADAGLTVADFVESLGEERRAMWQYPGDDVTLYCDFQITVREPIETIIFTSQAQTEIPQEDALPVYDFIDDQENHPDQRGRNEIICYDTNGVTADSPSVDAFLITVDVIPDFDYEFTYRIVDGSGIGRIDTTGLDSPDNSFRFIPHNEEGLETRYGNVIIEVTAAEANYSERFTLRYLSSDMRLVAYIGEKDPADVNPDDFSSTTVPDSWDAGVVLKNVDGRVMVDTDTSGMWDVQRTYNSAGNTTATQLYGLQCLVLYPGESFDLAAVSYVRPANSTAGVKRPYYMTEGVPAIDWSVPGSDQVSWSRYGVSFGTYADQDQKREVSGIIAFPEYGRVVNDGGIQQLEKSSTQTGRSWWYLDDEGEPENRLTITALKQGICYLSYTVAAFNETEDMLDYSQGTMTGGIWIFVVDPVDQELMASAKDYTSGGNMSMLVPYDISLSQLRNPVIDGVEYPSHWYLEEFGAVEELGSTTGTGIQGETYMGRAYVSFSSRNGSLGSIDLEPLGYGGRPVDIKTVSFNTTTAKPMVIDRNGIFQPEFKLAKGNEALLSDVRITGPFGLSSFDNVRHVSVRDEDGMLTGRNTENGTFDLSSVRKLVYYHHDGMNEAGKAMKEIILPEGIQELDLSPYNGDASRYDGLDCRLSYGPSRLGSSDTLQRLDVSYNLFSDLHLAGFDSLVEVEAEGLIENGVETASKNSGRTLTIEDSPRLKTVLADETWFNYIVADFQSLLYTDFIEWNSNVGSIPEISANKRMITRLQANSSDRLIGVNVAGSLSYLELIDDQQLDFVIGSSAISGDRNNTYIPDPDDSSSRTSPDWIRLVNLGGDSYVDEHWDGSGQDAAHYIGFSTVSGDVASGASSRNVRTIRLNKVGRLVWDDGGQKNLETLEVNNLVGGVRNHFINKLDDYMAGTSQAVALEKEIEELYDLSINNAEDLVNISINYVSPESAVDLRYAGSGSDEIMSIRVGSLESLLDMRYAGRTDGISVNATSTPAGWRNATVDLSYSAIENTSGQLSFTSISPSQNEMEIEEGKSGTVTIYASPVNFDPEMTVTASSGSSAVTVREISHNVFEISASAGSADTITDVAFTGVVSGVSRQTKVKVTVIEAALNTTPRVRFEVVPGDVYIEDAGKSTNLSIRIYQEEYNAETSEIVSSIDVTDTFFGSDNYPDLDLANPPEEYKFKWNFSDSSLVRITENDPFAMNVTITALYSDDETTFNASSELVDFADSISSDHVLEIGGKSRFTIESTQDEVTFHANGGTSSLTVNLFDENRGERPTSQKRTFEWSVEGGQNVFSYEISGTYKETVKITGKNSGTSYIEVSYRNREDSQPVTKRIYVTVHDVGAIVLDKTSAYFTWNGTVTFTATLYCECGTGISAEENVNFGYKASTNYENNGGYRFSRISRNQVSFKGSSIFVQGTITITSTSYKGYSFSATSIKPSFAKALQNDELREFNQPMLVSESISIQTDRIETDKRTASRSSLPSTNTPVQEEPVRLMRTMPIAAAASTRAVDNVSVNVRVGLLKLDKCPDLESLIITDSKSVTRHVVEIHANSCPNLKTIEFADSEIEWLEAYWEPWTAEDGNLIGRDVSTYRNMSNGKLYSASFSASVDKLEHLNLHSNVFGSSSAGRLVLGSWNVPLSYTKDEGRIMEGDSRWGIRDDFLAHLYCTNGYKWGLPSLDYLNLVDNGIYYEYGSSGFYHGAASIAARIGDGIPSDFQLSGRTRQTAGGNIYYWISGIKSWSQGHAHDNSYPKMSTAGINAGEIYSFQIDMFGGGYFWSFLGASGFVWVRPFG